MNLKANDNLAVIRTFARLGAGADVVSGGELSAALKAGVAPGAVSGFARVQCSAAIAGAARHGQLPLGAESVVLRLCGPDVYATLNVPRPESWPLRRTGVPSESSEPKASASPVAQSMSLPVSMVLRFS